MKIVLLARVPLATPPLCWAFRRIPHSLCIQFLHPPTPTSIKGG